MWHKGTANCEVTEMASIEEHAERARACASADQVVAEHLAHFRITRDQLLVELVSSQLPSAHHDSARALGEAAVAAMVSKHTAKAVDRQVVHRARRAHRREGSEAICPEHLECSARLAAQLVSLVRAVDRCQSELAAQLVHEVHAVLDALEAIRPTRSYTYHDWFYHNVVRLLDWNPDEQSQATNTKVPTPEARARVLQLRRRVRQIERRRARSPVTSGRT